MSLLRRVERELDQRFRKLFSSGEESHEQEAIEVYRYVLDQAAAKIQTLPKGRRGFPYNHALARIPLPSEAERPAYEAAFVDGDPLGQGIRERLSQEGVEPPADFSVEVMLEERTGPVEVLFTKREAPKPEQPEPQPKPTAVKLRVTQGKAAQEEFPLNTGRTNVGRLADILDDRQRLVRRNDVVFLEGDDPANATVSRAHAHIAYDAASGEYRLFDDRSAYGTSLFREGRLIQVAPGAGPGIALRPGDEIYFGQTKVRFEAAY